MQLAEIKTNVPPLRKDPVEPRELEYIAFSGQHEIAHGIFRSISKEQREKFTSKFILSGVIVGGVKKLKTFLSVSAEAAANEEKAFISETMDLFVFSSRNSGSCSRELFESLLLWADELTKLSLLQEALHYYDEALAGGVNKFPELYVSPFALPLTRWAIASIEFLFSLTVVFGFFAILTHSFTIHLIVLPLAIIPWALLRLGVGLMSAVAFTFFRDVRTILQMVLMFAFFSSPILFRADMFEAGTLQAKLVALHPITYFAALFQKPIYHAVFPSSTDWIVSFSPAVVSVLVGAWLVNKYKGEFYFYL
ncbi:MAG: hypothetical protein AAB209_08010 [Bacteroidota bacterium]